MLYCCAKDMFANSQKYTSLLEEIVGFFFFLFCSDFKMAKESVPNAKQMHAPGTSKLFLLIYSDQLC